VLTWHLRRFRRLQLLLASILPMRRLSTPVELMTAWMKMLFRTLSLVGSQNQR
jgi:hypothetical protein